jgi:glycosyltransferase involved in cell wall biosynthesis
MTAGPEHVVVLNDYASPTGGSTMVALASAIGLARRGVHVTLFTCVGPVAPQLRDVPNLDVICLGQPEIARNPSRTAAMIGGLRNGRAVRALRRVLSGSPRDRTVVHAHTWTKALSPFALAAVEDAGFPLAITLHDFFAACPNGGFFDYGKNELCERRPLSRSCWACRCDRRSHAQKLWRNLRTTLQNHLLRVPRRATCFIGVSEFSVARLRPFLPADVPVQMVRNPVDAARTAPAPVQRNRAFVYVGRFEQEKGVRLFAEAVRASGVDAVFIGDGALRSEIQRLCPQARFPGWLDTAAVAREVRAARALVFPPLWYETLGLVVVEAAAAGVPAIVSDRCAATDYIRDGVNGLYFTRGSVESLAAKMSALANADAEAGRLGQEAYNWYWDDPWTTDRHVAELLRVYRGLGRSQANETMTEVLHESARSV